MTKQTQARSWSWLLVSVYGCCRLRRLVTPAITPSQCGQRAQLMLLMTNGEGILLMMTTSIIYIQMLLGATQSHKSECYTFHPGIIDCVFVLTGNTSLNTLLPYTMTVPIVWTLRRPKCHVPFIQFACPTQLRMLTYHNTIGITQKNWDKNGGLRVTGGWAK